MAFVSKSERKFEYSQLNTTAIGPGAYLGQLDYKKAQAAAPFLTTTHRMNEKSTKHESPGPGSYTAPEKQSRISNQDISHRVSFTSRSERFNSKYPKLMPGPGSYNISSNWIKKKSRRNSKYSQQLMYFRTPSVPSIPTGQESQGYTTTNDGNLVRLFDQEIFTKSKESSAGQFQSKELSRNNSSKGTAWGKSKSRRVPDAKMSTNSSIGPGTYNLAFGTSGALYKIKPSSMFASSSKRPCHLPSTARDKLSNDSIDESGEEGLPGPGYYDSDLQTGFRSQSVPRSNQCFSSKTQRFKEKEPSYVGPGYYENLPQKIGSRKPGGSKAPFSSTNLRFKHNHDLQPGPGYYEIELNTSDTERKTLGRHGAFGATEKRFSSSKRHQTPGPGYYPPDSYKKIGLNSTIEKKASSMFVSKSKRDLLAPPEKTTSPAPGSYELSQEFGLKKSSTFGNMYASIMKSDKINKQVGFNAQTDRFNELGNQGNL